MTKLNFKASLFPFKGGVALTVGAGGLSPVAASIAGGVTVGGGASMINNPISKKMFGERMTGKDYFTDVATGSVIGVMTGGIGAGLRTIWNDFLFVFCGASFCYLNLFFNVFFCLHNY